VQHVFWLIPGRLAGRAGPNRRPWDLVEIRSLGIGAVLSVNDGEACDPRAFAPLGLRYRCVAMPPNEPPAPGDGDRCREALPEAYAWVRERHEEGLAVLVHCSSGKDRTGLFMSYFLMKDEGLDPAAAIARVREVRPIALSAMGWEGLARGVLADLA